MSVALSHFLLLFLLHDMLTDSFLPLTNAQRAVVPEVITTASKHVAAGTPDLQIVELCRINEFRVAANERSCGFWMSNARLDFIIGQGLAHCLIDAVGSLLRLACREIVEARAAR